MKAAPFRPVSVAAPTALPRGRAGTLGIITVLHIGLLWAIGSRAPQESTHHTAPREVVATFIVPETAPAPEPAQVLEQPKPVPRQPAPPPKKAAPRPKRAEPRPEPPPSQQAITEPQPAPAAVEPAPPPVVAAPPAPSAPAPAPAPASAPAQPKTITSGIEYIQAPPPDYPPMSRRMGEEGTVALRVLVNDKGRPERIEVQKSSGSSRLDEAARQAASRYVFKPFIEGGRPVAAYVIVPFKFQLNS